MLNRHMFHWSDFFVCPPHSFHNGVKLQRKTSKILLSLNMLLLLLLLSVLKMLNITCSTGRIFLFTLHTASIRFVSNETVMVNIKKKILNLNVLLLFLSVLRPKIKNSELENCRSCQVLQFSYKKYLHLIS